MIGKFAVPYYPTGNADIIKDGKGAINPWSLRSLYLRTRSGVRVKFTLKATKEWGDEREGVSQTWGYKRVSYETEGNRWLKLGPSKTLGFHWRTRTLFSPTCCLRGSQDSEGVHMDPGKWIQSAPTWEPESNRRHEQKTVNRHPS